jgi:uncharacterized protein with gpF-like domain
VPSLSEISDNQRRAVLRAFNSVIASIRDSATLADLTMLIEQGQIDAVIDMLQLDRATFATLEQAIADAYRIGGETAMGQIGRIPVDGMSMRLVFDVRSPAAEAWLATSSNRIVEIVAEQRAVVRSTLQYGMESGLNPRSTALDIIGRIDTVTGNRIGGVIGLTEQQAGWVSNARQELLDLDSNYFSRALRDKRFDSTVRRAIADGKSLTQTQIDKAITQMQNRAQRYRGEAIARTESINALRSGHHDAVMQAVDAGDVDERDTYHEWDATGGARTRDAHIAADGQRRPIKQPFIVGDERMMYPGDPAGSAKNTINCRCRERTVIDFAGKVKRIEGFG